LKLGEEKPPGYRGEKDERFDLDADHVGPELSASEKELCHEERDPESSDIRRYQRSAN
jgi:hypothetical protein